MSSTPIHLITDRNASRQYVVDAITGSGWTDIEGFDVEAIVDALNVLVPYEQYFGQQAEVAYGIRYLTPYATRLHAFDLARNAIAELPDAWRKEPLVELMGAVLSLDQDPRDVWETRLIELLDMVGGTAKATREELIPPLCVAVVQRYVDDETDIDLLPPGSRVATVIGGLLRLVGGLPVAQQSKCLESAYGLLVPEEPEPEAVLEDGIVPDEDEEPVERGTDTQLAVLAALDRQARTLPPAERAALLVSSSVVASGIDRPLQMARQFHSLVTDAGTLPAPLRQDVMKAIGSRYRFAIDQEWDVAPSAEAADVMHAVLLLIPPAH